MKGKGPTVEEAIRIEAYLLSEKAGHPAGMQHYFWEQAQAIVQARTTAVAVAVKTVAAKKSKPAKGKKKEKEKEEAKPKAAKEAKPKAAKKSAAVAKEQQLSLGGETSAPPRKGKSKK